ncbi:MAG: hypothetical protein RRC34_14785 [Lentisphaeria bacterium]|nr:hypothetical protein [Lentisphaeria bacterium]
MNVMDGKRTKRCAGCSAELEYSPGSGHLHCPYCGADTPVEGDRHAVEELDFQRFLAAAENEEGTWESVDHPCGGCGAVVSLANNVDNDHCPFCGSDIHRADEQRRRIRPRSLLPFAISQEQVQEVFLRWLHRIWFAPNDLKKLARATRVNGVYVPYWTYDMEVTTRYSGRRGDHYYVTEHYRDSKGKTRTRRKRKTRWRSASGVVDNRFDDILVIGSHSLPHHFAEKLEPWDLRNLVPFSDDYLAGFRVENYSVSLPAGFDSAKQKVDPVIRRTVCRDIGGDVQHISTLNCDWRDISFKHLLLPVWISAYRYKNKPYRFLVNGRTGEVQAERPWSFIKIALLVLAIAAAVMLMLLIFGVVGGEIAVR